MRELKIIYGDDCSRCHQMMHFLPNRCSENGYLYSAENYKESLYKDEISTLPLIVIKNEEGDVSKLTMEDFISNQDKWKIQS